MQNIMFFSIVSSHRQTVAYLHWLDFNEKYFYMFYLRSYFIFETDDIRECNNIIKNIIDNAKEPRKFKIGEVSVTLKPVKDSWNSLSTVINQLTLNSFVAEDPRFRKRGRND